MNTNKSNLFKAFVGVFIIYILLCILVTAFCWSGGWQTLEDNGKAFIYAGFVGAGACALINMNGPTLSIRMLLPPDPNRPVNTDPVANWAMRGMVASLLLLATGFLVLDFNYCGRLYCG